MKTRTLATMVAINEISLEPFEWGVSDCCAAVARVVRAATGCDVFPFSYRTKEEADRELNSYGGLLVAATVTLGNEGVPAAETRDGDPLLIDAPQTGVTAAVRFNDRAVFRTERGWMSIPITSKRVLRAWRVG